MDKRTNKRTKKAAGPVNGNVHTQTTESTKPQTKTATVETTTQEVALGLDISTSVTGVCLLDLRSGAWRVLEPIDLTKTTGLFNKADKALEMILGLCKGYNVREIYVEANMKVFAKGASSADTIMTLAKMNGLVSYLVHKRYGCEVRDVNVSSARKAVGYKNDKSDKRKVKEKVFDYVTTKHPEFPWKTHVAKSGAHKGVEVYDKEMKDVCDAWVICAGGMKLSAAGNLTTVEDANDD